MLDVDGDGAAGTFTDDLDTINTLGKLDVSGFAKQGDDIIRVDEDHHEATFGHVLGNGDGPCVMTGELKQCLAAFKSFELDESGLVINATGTFHKSVGILRRDDGLIVVDDGNRIVCHVTCLKHENDGEEGEDLDQVSHRR